ncbi:MAG: hypothetical protein ACR2P1_01645 [Pseudomonadales bacterium]
MKLAALTLEQLPAWLEAATVADQQALGTKRVAATFKLAAYWNDPVTELHLAALYEIESGSDGVQLYTLVTDQTEYLQQLLAIDQAMTLGELSHALQTPVLDSNSALILQTVDIAKPWGKEIWYTGIEQRGVCKIGDADLYCPLPWAIAALPDFLLGPAEDTIVLLKILDPLPEPVYGDLYFELHEVKQEVYVVTQVDTACWANGTGAIRIGFNQQKRQSYGSDTEFKNAYMEAVNRYRQVRERIDAELDQQRAQQGIDASAVVTAEQTRQWLSAVPQALRTQEKTLRQTMDEFTGLHPLAVGDVIVIPQRLPHALQHGVRTIEFQTPVYERQIVSFAQKVLTQSHWDTAAAMQITQLDPYVAPEFVAQEIDGCKRSQIVDFDDFSVWRINLPVAARLQLHGMTYKLVIVITGTVQIGDVLCQPEQALLVPGHAFPTAMQNVKSAGSAGSVVLIAEPKVSKASRT